MYTPATEHTERIRAVVKYKVIQRNPRRSGSPDIENPFINLYTSRWLFIHRPHPNREEMECCIVFRELRSDRSLVEKFWIRTHCIEVRFPNRARGCILGWERTASEGACNERQDHQNPVTQLAGKYEPLRNAPIGMSTGTMVPFSSLNGGPSLVPEKLSKAYLGFT